MLSRVAGIGYASEWSKAYFGNDRRRKNEFYTKAGRLAGPADAERTIAGKDLNSASPADVLRMLGA